MRINSRQHRVIASVLFTLSLAAWPALLRAGAVTPCPPECPTGSNTVYSEVLILPAAGGGDFFQLTPPYALNVIRNIAAGGGFGDVNLTNGTVKILAAAASLSPQFTVLGQVVDMFTLDGLPPGTEVSVIVDFAANGTGLIPLNGHSETAMVQLGQGPGNGQTSQTKVYQAGNQVMAGQIYSIALDAGLSFAATIGTPFQLNYLLRLDTSDQSSFDFSGTAELSFHLPTGVTLTSAGGFGSPASAPEPATFPLSGATLLVVMVRRWHRPRARRLGLK